MEYRHGITKQMIIRLMNMSESGSNSKEFTFKDHLEDAKNIIKDNLREKAKEKADAVNARRKEDAAINGLKQFEKAKPESILENHVNAKAWFLVKLFIEYLLDSKDPYYVAYANMLKAEIKASREIEKQNILKKIETKVLREGGGKGVYTLDEVGKVLGVTKERARQIEDAALRSFKHPSVSKELQKYIYA